MEHSRLTDSQIIAMLKQTETGASVPKPCRQHGFRSTTSYKRSNKLGGLDPALMSQLKKLRDEKPRLKGK